MLFPERLAFARLGVSQALPPEEKEKQADGKSAPAPPRVSVEEVAQQAVARLELPKPVIHTSPDEDRAQVVHVPTWMWVEKSTWGPVSRTAEVTGVRVTATARPRSAVWSMGDGEQVTCRGPGTPYSVRFRPEATSPDCGHVYRRASVSAPGGRFTVSVRVTWDVEWTGGGKSGVVRGLTIGAERQLVVDEVQTVVVR